MGAGSGCSHDQSDNIPIHASENVAITLLPRLGYAPCISPPSTSDPANASIACSASRASPATA
jgi:hypothetical protein